MVIVSQDSGGRRAEDAYEAFLMRGYERWRAADAYADAQAGTQADAPRDYLLLEHPAEELATCALCYTSGTTGRPKGVETTFRGSYLTALGNCIESELNGDTVYLWVLPMFHCCGWTFPWAVTATMGTHYLLRNVDYTKIWDALLHGGVTHYSGAPTVQMGVVHAQQARPLPRTVRVSVAASAPTAQLLSRMEALHLQPVHVYGLTETVGTFAYAVWPQQPAVCRAGVARPGRRDACASASAPGARDGHQRRDACGAPYGGGSERRACGCLARWPGGGRDCDARQRRDEGLLPRRGGDAKRDAPRLVPYGRLGRAPPGGRAPDLGPWEGHHHFRRRERIVGGRRAGACLASVGARVGGGCTPRPEVGRDGVRVRGAQRRRRPCAARRFRRPGGRTTCACAHCTLPQAHERVRGAAWLRHPRGAPENQHRQYVVCLTQKSRNACSARASRSCSGR